MTTRELYFKAKYLGDGMPVGRLFFTIKNEEGIIQVWGGSLCICYRDDIDETLEKIENMEKTSGFMFWNISPEGEKFYTENWNVIGKGLANMVLNQR